MSCGGEAAGSASSDSTRISNRITDWIWARAATWLRSPGGLVFSPEGAFSRTLVFGAAAVFTLPTVNYFWRYEGGAPQWFFVASVTLALAAFLIVVFGRVLVAAVLTNAIVGIVAIVAWAKHQAMDMALHAYDLVFYLSSWSTVSFLWRDFRIYVIGLAIALLATVLVAVLAYRFDARPVSRRRALAAFAVLALIAGLAAEVKGERRHTQYYWNGLHISSFYSSWAETLEALWRGQLIEAANTAPGLP